jgi:PAS domain S-box-containing protein
MIAIDAGFHIWIVEDNSGDFPLIESWLYERYAAADILRLPDITALGTRFGKGKTPNVVLISTDPAGNEPQLLKAISRISAIAPVIVLADFSTESLAGRCMDEGAADYLIKTGLTPGLLHKSIGYAVRVHEKGKQLRQSNQANQLLFYQSPAPQWIYDVETSKFLDINDAAVRKYGYSREEFLSMSVFDIRPEEDRESVVDMIDSVRRHQSYSSGCFRHIKKNGEILRVEIESNTLHYRGCDARIVVVNDITERLFTERLFTFEKNIYEFNADPKVSFSEVMNRLVREVQKLIPQSRPLVMSVTPELTPKVVAHDNFDYNFLKWLESVNLENTLFYQGSPLYASHIGTDPHWATFHEAVSPYGFSACWTIPAKKRHNKPVAGLVLYFKTERTPTSEEQALLARISSVIGVLMENRLSTEETESAMERYDIVAKATSDTIWDWKIQDDSFTWNKGILGVFGYKRDQVGKTSRWWFERVHPEDSIRVSVKLYNFLEEKVEKWQDEYRFACADGTYKYVFDRGFLVKDESGRPIRMIGAMQDVTRQKEEEQRLKLLETVVTQTKDSVIITESKKSDSGIPKIVFVNPAFSNMTGYRFKEVVGKSPAIFMGRQSVANEISKLSEALRNKKEFKFETLNRKKTGEEYWVNFSMIPITNKEGDHSHWISIQRDITEEKKQEKEKEQLIRELTQNNKDLKQFSYITSHNLRAPLSNLTGLLNLIEDIPVENPELREILDGFSKSTHLLNETINDLVKVIIIKDNPSIEKEEVPIQDIFENVFSQLNFLISMHKPIIKLDLRESKIANINKAYLESILLNLMTNAIKYRATGRQLRISVSSKISGRNTILTFKDNGIGIDLERNADRIFGLYQRFHNYPDSKGLGLYLVKSQVETMGGNITVQSEVNKGTTFTLTFKNTN